MGASYPPALSGTSYGLKRIVHCPPPPPPRVVESVGETIATTTINDEVTSPLSAASGCIRGVFLGKTFQSTNGIC